MTFKSSLHRFSSALDNISPNDIKTKESSILDFKEKKKSYQINTLNSSFKALLNSINELNELKEADEIKEQLSELKDSFENKDFETARQIAANLLILEAKLSYPQKTESLTFNIKNIPLEIKEDMKADLNELETCFKADAFRASVILCGRLLETALHRIYFQATNNDLLEKAPGIGLGSLIAKLKQNNIELDPAISQQIHLINQIRIYSVHKKKQAFYPSKEQTNAIILYTIDVIKKLFA